MKRDGELFSVRIRITMAGALLLGAAAFVFGYWKYADYQDLLKFAATSAAISIALYNAYFARKAFEISVRERQLATLTAFSNEYYGREAKEVRAKMRDLFVTMAGKTQTDIHECLLKNPANKEIVTDVLNLWEDVAYAVKQDRIEIEMVDDLIGSVIRRSHNLVQPVLKQWREIDKQESSWEHFEWLAVELGKMQQKRRP